MKNSESLRVKAFAFLYVSDSGDARVPKEGELRQALTWLIQSARLEDQNRNTESNLLEELEEIGGVFHEENFVARAEKDDVDKAAQDLAPI